MKKVKLFPVEGDDRWFYYFHGECFASALGKVVVNTLNAASWPK